MGFSMLACVAFRPFGRQLTNDCETLVAFPQVANMEAGDHSAVIDAQKCQLTDNSCRHASGPLPVCASSGSHPQGSHVAGGSGSQCGD